jgi:hypothetical protein
MTQDLLDILYNMKVLVGDYFLNLLSIVKELHTFLDSIYDNGSRGSSVSIRVVSGYGLDDRAIGVRSPAGAKDFSSSLCVQTGSGAHPASCTMGTGCPFPWGKARPGRDADHSPHLVPRSLMSRSYTSFRPSFSMACSGTALVLSITMCVYYFRFSRHS